MTKELDERLCQKYPEIFRDRHAPMNQSCMFWGFECGDGWFALIDTLCSELMRHSTPEQIPVAEQVKEKFAGLRFYATTYTDTQFALIDFAEALSYRICETCGTTANVQCYTNGRHRTLCDSCATAEGRDLEKI
jgi:hypothetical protein